MPDLIDELVGIAPGDRLDALRAKRPTARSDAQTTYEALVTSPADLGRASARRVLDVARLTVAPGFINIHDHPRPKALSRPVNMLTQGVTTEIFNPDGGGVAMSIPDRTGQSSFAISVAAHSNLMTDAMIENTVAIMRDVTQAIAEEDGAANLRR